MNNKYPVKINGILYKIGAHNLTYWRPGNDWQRSTKTIAELEFAVKVRDARKGSKSKMESKYE